MRWIDRTELSFSNSLPQHFADSKKNWLDIILDDLLDVRRLALPRPHHLSLHQAWIQLVRSDEIEIRAGISENLLTRRQITVQHLKHSFLQTRKRIVQHRAIKRFLILEVVIQERLVDPCLLGNRVGAGTGDAMLGKLLRRCRQYCGTALFRLAARSHPAATPRVATMQNARH